MPLDQWLMSVQILDETSKETRQLNVLEYMWTQDGSKVYVNEDTLEFLIYNELP
jgi:hypothetical protein